MPAGLLPDEGIGGQLQYILSSSISGVLPWQLRLFVNDIVPDNTTKLADLVEATWLGYNRASLDRSKWTLPSVADGCARSTWGTDPIEWTCHSTDHPTNYGVAYVDFTTGVIRWIQRFDDADLRPLEPNQRFQLLPVYTLTSAECGGIMVNQPKRRRSRRRSV